MPERGKEEAKRICLSEGIEPGDAELLIAAKKEGDILVTNDKILRTIASTRGVQVHWAVTAVLKSAKKGEISIREAKTIIKELVKAGLRLKSKTLVAIYEVLDGLER